MQLLRNFLIICFTLASLITSSWMHAKAKKTRSLQLNSTKKITRAGNPLFNPTLGLNTVRRLNINSAAIDSLRLNDRAVTAAKIAPGAVQSTAIAAGAVGQTQLASTVQFVFTNTASNTPNTLVLRNNSGNFAAGTITANAISLDGNLTCTGTASIDNAVFMNGIVGKTVNVLSYTPVFIDTSTGQLGTVASSKRYKNDIEGLSTMKAELMQLRPVSFTYKNDPNKITQYGLIAEEVKQVLPELVVYNKDHQAETVAYHLLPALLLNEYQDHEKRLISMETDAAALREQNAKINQIIDEIIHLLKK